MPEYIRHNPDSICYSLTEDELYRLENKNQSIWKDLFLVSMSIAIPTTINAVIEYKQNEIVTLSLTLFLNSLFAALGIILCLIFGIIWYTTRSETNKLIQTIKQKPKMPMPPSTTFLGSMNMHSK